uniref:Uncharacterized protein n=1 Tax=Rhizophora mucronata TaxID=61149 RepID=A0A2P2N769_RHIMU
MSVAYMQISRYLNKTSLPSNSHRPQKSHVHSFAN